MPEGAKDISYYLITSKFDSAAGVSFVLDKDEYNEFKKDFSCNIVLVDTCKESKSEKNRNHMNYKMVSKYGKKCINSLISDDLSEYEILNLTITKQDVPIYGIGIVGNNETGKIIIFYNYERYPDCDYYKDILNDDI